jgi:hypothetical protein
LHPAFLMMRTPLTQLCLAAVLSTGALFAAGCGDDDGNRESAAPNNREVNEDRGNKDRAALGPEISVSGCLTANLEGGSYALTPSDSTRSSADRSVQMPGRETVTYELVGDAEDFRRHANTVVTARGREDAAVRRDAEVEREDESAQSAKSGSGTPTVETKEEVEVNVRRLHVTSVVASGTACPSLGDQGRPSTQPARPQTQQ